MLILCRLMISSVLVVWCRYWLVRCSEVVLCVLMIFGLVMILVVYLLNLCIVLFSVVCMLGVIYVSVERLCVGMVVFG